MRLRHKTWQEEMISSHKDIALEKTAIDEKSIPPFNMLEIGSGCGLFLLVLAKKHPENQYLGVEIQRTAFAIGIKKYVTDENRPTNIHYINAPIEALLPTLEDESLDCIFLNFNDPWPKKRHHRRRLTYPTKLEEYYRVLKKGGKLLVRTDNDDYFEGTKEYFAEFNKFSYKVDENAEPFEVMSEYESKFRSTGKSIHALSAIKL